MTEVVEPADWRSAPWGAAQGTTHEIRRWPDGAGGYVARVSVAEIAAPGPFTALPGFQRWLAVLDDGGDLALTIGGRPWRGMPGAHVTFDGAEPVHATVSARPARVWNLIVRAHVPWSARWHRERGTVTVAPGVAVVHAIDTGQTRITTSGQAMALAVEAPAIVAHLGLGC